MRAVPGTEIRDTLEYENLLAHFPHISEHIVLKKALEELDLELRSSRDLSRRLLAEREKRNLARRMKQKETLMRLHGEREILNNYNTRLLTASIRTWFSSQISRVRRRIDAIRMRLQERSRRARHARAYSLPPSLLDIRSLDPIDRSMVLRDWIERRRTKV